MARGGSHGQAEVVGGVRVGGAAVERGAAAGAGAGGSAAEMPEKAQNNIHHRPMVSAFLCALLLVCLNSSCKSDPQGARVGQWQVTNRDKNVLVPAEVKGAGTVVLTNSGVGLRDYILSNRESREAWQQKKDAFPVGGPQYTWLSQFTLSSHSGAIPPRGDIHLMSGQPLVGRLLVSNVWKEPHNLVLIFLLDYQPLLIEVESGTHAAFRTPTIVVGEETAYEFTLPPLSPGFHHLSILLLVDCESEPNDLSCAIFQQRAATEQRYDLWVDIDDLPENVPRFKRFDDALMANAYMLVFDVASSNQPDRIATQLSLARGSRAQFDLVFWGNEPVAVDSGSEIATIPVGIAVFWNNRMTNWGRYELDPQRRFRLPIDVAAPNDDGDHSLQVVVFQTPDHAQFDRGGAPVSFGKATFSRQIRVRIESEFLATPR